MLDLHRSALPQIGTDASSSQCQSGRYIICWNIHQSPSASWEIWVANNFLYFSFFLLLLLILVIDNFTCLNHWSSGHHLFGFLGDLLPVSSILSVTRTFLWRNLSMAPKLKFYFILINITSFEIMTFIRINQFILYEKNIIRFLNTANESQKKTHCPSLRYRKYGESVLRCSVFTCHLADFLSAIMTAIKHGISLRRRNGSILRRSIWYVLYNRAFQINFFPRRNLVTL